MATILPESASTMDRYSCETQDEEDPSFGYAPESHFNGTSGDNAPDEPDSLVVGHGAIIPRWDVRTQPDRKLQYFVKVDSFPTSDHAKTAVKALQAAAQSWNDLELGISIVETTDESSSNFYLVYAVSPKVGKGRNTIARAFFPHEIDQDIIVFSNAWEGKNLKTMNNVFEHELGHVLGLRHEFAITGDKYNPDLKPEKEAAVQFMGMNYNSVMSYKQPPSINSSDREQTIAFYKLINGHHIDSVPIVDCAPRIRAVMQKI